MAPTKVVCYIPTPSSSPRLLCPGGYKERVKSQFEARGKEYDARGDYHRFLAQTLIATANLQQGETVLDAACGTGIVSYLAADKVAPDGSVTGVDISKTMLDVAESKRKGHPMAAKVHFQCTDLEETSFPDATFDAILCSAALVFLSDVPGALATWRRWLKPGGASRVVFNTPKQHASAAFEVFAAEGLKVGAPKIEDPSTIFSSEYDVRTILGKAGFGTVDVRTWLAGRGYQGTSAAEYAASMWKVCSASPFSPVDQLVGTEAAEAWQRGFLAAATRLAEEKLTGDDGVIRDNHDMFWVVARNDAQK